jgi:hypothetical protein
MPAANAAAVAPPRLPKEERRLLSAGPAGHSFLEFSLSLCVAFPETGVASSEQPCESFMKLSLHYFFLAL